MVRNGWVSLSEFMKDPVHCKTSRWSRLHPGKGGHTQSQYHPPFEWWNHPMGISPSIPYCWWFRNPANHLGCLSLKPCKQWDKLPSSTGERRISSINSIIHPNFTHIYPPMRIGRKNPYHPPRRMIPPSIHSPNGCRWATARFGRPENACASRRCQVPWGRGFFHVGRLGWEG